MKWLIQYRGALTSCNYSCSYCPFAKSLMDHKQIESDSRQLNRFVAWVNKRPEQIGILFTPWGEALYVKHYQQAMLKLSYMNNVFKVAIQTNLSGSLEWLDKGQKTCIALWTTYHPGQADFDEFIQKCGYLDQIGIRYSVGIVGLKEHLDRIYALRQSLPLHVYVWVNAYKRNENYYNIEELEKIQAIDPLFGYNNQYHATYGKPCRAGHTSFSIDGQGNLFRCHFIRPDVSNIYHDQFEKTLKPRVCTNRTCTCHIGYINSFDLNLYSIFGNGILERIPQEPVWQETVWQEKWKMGK